MERDAISCRLCDAHLAMCSMTPQPTGLRNCMNSVALHFVRALNQDCNAILHIAILNSASDSCRHSGSHRIGWQLTSCAADASQCSAPRWTTRSNSALQTAVLSAAASGSARRLRALKAWRRLYPDTPGDDQLHNTRQ